jgi:hypothetical protein
MDFRLEYPILVGDKTVSTLSVKRPKVRDVAAMEKVRQAEGDFAAGLAMVARVTGLAAEAVDEIDSADFTELSKVIEGFTRRRGPAIGEPSPQTSPTS